MEIKSQNVSQTITQSQPSSSKQTSDSDAKFADELKDLKKSEEVKTEKGEKAEKENVKSEKEELKSEKSDNEEGKDEKVVEAIDNLEDTVLKINRTEDYAEGFIKDINNKTDINREGADVINNDFNIENKDLLPQMMPNMNFGGDGQPFSSFLNNGKQEDSNGGRLSSSAKDLAEEAAILSTMAENVAIANQRNAAEEKTVMNEAGIKKINTQTSMVEDTIVKYDTILMNEADVEMFANLVDGKEVNLNSLTASENAQKSAQVSKTLADMLAKAMEDNKPIRIEFDNGISVIIKITRDGKLSADFLPSTQIAEAYLKENLPLLKQRLSDQNLDYDQLNQRERQNREREQNRKKGNENE